jgi:type VII secretion-associated serine protease mycosin
VRRAAAAGLALLLLTGLLPVGAGATAAAATGASAAAPASGSVPQRSSDAVRDREYWLDEYGIEDAWAVTRGAGVTIAVIDTGVDGGVSELSGAVIDGTDVSGLGTANGQTPVGSDGREHGTMVASLAAGRGTGAGAGVIGAAPEASLLSISISFGGGVDSDSEIADAVRWATDHGADVINMSLTRNTLDWPESWDDAFLYAMDHDVVIVAAAGNRGSGTVEVGAPATLPGVLTVAGVDENGTASWDASAQGITIGVAAPSESLVGVVPGGGHVIWSGTSGAAPIVAGIVALVRAAHPELDADNVIQRVVATARDAGPPGADFSYGYGLVNAAAAVSAQVPTVSENPMGDLHEWVRVNRRATGSPAPTATVTSVPEPTAPESAGPPNLVGTALPSVTLLQLVGMPTLVIALIAFVWVGLVVGAVRHYKWLRRTR